MPTLEGDHLELGLKMKKARWGHTSVAGRALDEQMEAEKSACLGTRRSQKGECTPDSGLSGYRVIGLSVCGSRSQAKDHRLRTVRQCGYWPNPFSPLPVSTAPGRG